MILLCVTMFFVTTVFVTLLANVTNIFLNTSLRVLFSKIVCGINTFAVVYESVPCLLGTLHFK